MVKAIRIHDLGGPEVMQWEEVQLGNPKEGEIRIRTTAIGVNFIDVYFRKGVYSAPALPFTPGTYLPSSSDSSSTSTAIYYRYAIPSHKFLPSTASIAISTI